MQPLHTVHLTHLRETVSGDAAAAVLGTDYCSTLAVAGLAADELGAAAGDFTLHYRNRRNSVGPRPRNNVEGHSSEFPILSIPDVSTRKRNVLTPLAFNLSKQEANEHIRFGD